MSVIRTARSPIPWASAQSYIRLAPVAASFSLRRLPVLSTPTKTPALTIYDLYRPIMIQKKGPSKERILEVFARVVRLDEIPGARGHVQPRAGAGTGVGQPGARVRRDACRVTRLGVAMPDRKALPGQVGPECSQLVCRGG